MENERFKERIRRVARVSAVILSIYLLFPLYICGRNFCEGFMDGYHSAESTARVLTFGFLFLLAAVVAAITAIVNSLWLLFGMKKGETPFHADNGKRMRRIGVMLMLIEPLLILYRGELSGIYGISFAAGLIMYNVSLLFDYGAHLQQESDETL